MELEIKEEGGFKYASHGSGEPLVLLHGLFGALSNFGTLFEYFGKSYEVVVPLLPLYDLPPSETSVSSLADYVLRFIDFRGYDKVHYLGNSLGGHVGLVCTLEKQERVKSLILTGSSGLFEKAFGDTFPKRSSYEFMQERTELTFYDPKLATKDLVDEVFDIVNNREKALRVLYMAKSAMRHNLKDELQNITIPVLLIWGKNDTITPPFVGEEFHKLLPNSTLIWFDKCGHVPMMEHPTEFNLELERFLRDIDKK
jgi:pimeloyl-ACP methyl ester carboxylesterase